jgi:hypothetical protein
VTHWHRERWRKLYLREPVDQELMPWQVRGLRDLLIRLAEDDGRVARDLHALTLRLRAGHELAPHVETLLEDGFLVATEGGVYVRNLPVAQGDDAPEDAEDEPAVPSSETKADRRRRLARVRAKRARELRTQRDEQRDAGAYGLRTQSVTERDGVTPSPSPLASPLPLPDSQKSQPKEKRESTRARDEVRTQSVTERDAGAYAERDVNSVTRTRDALRESLTVVPHDEDRQAFEQWQVAFGKSGAEYSARRAMALAARRQAGMTRQDVLDALAGAKLDPWVNGTKDGQRHESIACIFGDADRYEGFRDAGRAARLGLTVPRAAGGAPAIRNSGTELLERFRDMQAGNERLGGID